MEVGTPDIIACIAVDSQDDDIYIPGYGQFAVAEMKTERGHLSEIQIKRLREWIDVKALVIVSLSANEVHDLMVKRESNWP